MKTKLFLWIVVAVLTPSCSILAAQTSSQSPPLRIVVIGDSTVCNYDLKRPERGWGMFLEQAFRPGTVKVSNLAAAGRSTKTFIAEGRWAQALALQTDFVFIQFGHNDSHAPDRPESTNAATDYRDYLRRYIDDTRTVGAIPILITPMVRRTFHPDGTLDDNLQPYADAMKAVAAEKGVALIDIHATSWAFFEPLGPKAAQEFASKPTDPTHFNAKGAHAIASLVVNALADQSFRPLNNLLRHPLPKTEP